jgi:hypothetical protein
MMVREIKFILYEKMMMIDYVHYILIHINYI